MRGYGHIPSVLIIVILSALLAACSSSEEAFDLTRFHENGTYPVLESGEGVASYYANRFHGRSTASGEKYDKDMLTGAHRTYPFGTIVRVTTVKSGRSVIVRINDRGPYKKTRIIDISRAAAEELEMIRAGIVDVRLDVLSWGEE